jgi:hypothetical protein
MNSCARFLALAAAVTALFAGCTPKPKTMPAIDARNIGAYNGWRSSAALQFTSEPWKEFDDAVQEIRLKVTREGSTGSDAVKAALCERLNGLTFREAMVMGYRARLERLEPMRDELRSIVNQNALLVPKSGDSGAAAELERRRSRQSQQLQTMIDEIAAARKRITELGGNVAALSEQDSSAAAQPLAREAALSEIRTMIDDRLKFAEERYGSWNIKFDIDGSVVTGADRDRFLTLREAAKATGATVIAVHIRDKWHFFDEVVHPLELSPAVLANLTEPDKQNVALRWKLMHAEVWARSVARQEYERGDQIEKPEDDLTQSGAKKPDMKPIQPELPR